MFAKSLATLFLVAATVTGHATSHFGGRVDCEGLATIQGALFTKKAVIKISLNGYVSNGHKGHIAFIENDRYPHDPQLSSCEMKATTLTCTGYGYGNGPELRVDINVKTMKGSGYYFNPWGKGNIQVPNEANTFDMASLNCKQL